MATSTTTGAPANVAGSSVGEQRADDGRSVSVFRCLFPNPHGWEESAESSQESTVTDESHAESQTTDEGTDENNVYDTTPEEPTAGMYNPEVPTFTPEVPPAPADNPAAPERTPSPADNPAAPETPVTPVNSSSNVPTAPINNSNSSPVDATPDGNVSSPPVTQPLSASTTGSQAIDAGDISSDPDTMEHDEYKSLVAKQSGVSRRVIRNSMKPTLWRHQRHPKASLCLFDAVDDGVRIAQSGLLWSIDGKMFEIVFVSSLGWMQQRAERSRSHRVAYSDNTIYVVIRAASLQGTSIHFEQLLKLVASTLFREGRASSVVNFAAITKAKKLAADFVEKNQRDYTAWVKIKYMRTMKEIREQEEEERERERLLQEQEAARAKRAQEREEAKQKKQELRDLKRQEELARRAAIVAARKTAKAEKQKRDRKFRQEVKVAVLQVVHKLEQELHAKLLECVEKSRAEIEADLGHRIAQCEDSVENGLVTIASFDKFKATVDNFKATVEKRFKSMKSTKKKTKRQDKSNDENMDPEPKLKRTKSRAWATSAVNNSASEPPVSVPNNFAIMPSPMSNTLRMTTHPSAEQSTWWVHGHVNPPQPAIVALGQQRTNVIGTPRYTSPVFGQRNYSR